MCRLVKAVWTETAEGEQRTCKEYQSMNGMSLIIIIIIIVGRDSSVGIATRYGLGGLGIESRWGEISHTRPDRPWGPPSLLYNGYRIFPGGKAAGAWR